MRREEGEWMKQSLSRSSNPQLFYISLNSQENTSVQVLSREFCKFHRNTFSREIVAVTAPECIMNQS